MDEFLQDGYYGKTLLLTALYQFGFFLVALIFKTHKVTDFAGCTSFIFLSVVTFFTFENEVDFHNVRTINNLLQVVWGVRLGFFLFTRILKWGKDNRLNNAWYRICIFWTLQILWSWSVSLSVLYLNDPANKLSIDASAIKTQDYIGWTLWGIGFLYQAIGDSQKFAYREKEGQATPWPTEGLWANSRHPNYFGELSMWWGIYISAIGHLVSDDDNFIIASPLVIMFLLIFLSGIPIIEKKYDEKHGEDADYIEYIRSTSPIIPFPKSIYRELPRIVKTICFFDFTYWNKKVHSQPETAGYTKMGKNE